MSDSDSSVPSSAASPAAGSAASASDAPAELRQPSSPLLTMAERRRVRLRRVRSVSMAQEIVTEDEKQRRAQPDKPIHRARDSLFSWTSGFQHYEGVMNWAFLLLFIGGVRLGLENFNKYGIRVDPNFWLNAMFQNVSSGSGEYPTLLLFIFLHMIMLATLFIEKQIAKGNLNASFGSLIHYSNYLLTLITPAYVIRKKYEYIGPLNATIMCTLYSVAFLKIWSYVQVNQWCRDHARIAERRIGFRSPSVVDFTSRMTAGVGPDADKKHLGSRGVMVQYPDNLTVRDLYYFWCAPTLCYELNFPKMERTRKLFLLRRALEVVIGTNIVLALIQQWIFPSVINSLIPFSNMDVSKASERMLKIALPNHLIWLTWFYLIFHSWLNTVGEMMRFADREFYLDWWNANNILVFWKTWNLPVHRWCVRHLFKPILKAGYSVLTAQLVVFVFSAFFHEYIVSVPLGVFKWYAAFGMVMQVPLIFISDLLERKVGPRAGNLVVWVSLIIGQPLAIMMYYHDYVVEHYGEELISFFGTMSK